MTKTFYLMRHGETLFNTRRKIQGWCDSPLTQNGIRQAQEAAKFFDTIKLDHLYSSSSERACDTAELVTRNRMSYKRLKGLREMNFGVYESESEDLHPEYSSRDSHYVQFGGESRQQLRERMLETCTHIMEQDEHDSVLAVSHAGACKQFLSHWHDPNKVLKNGIPNCCIFQYQYSDRVFKLVDIFHFPDLKE
ncbi:histidine phosphatase family protein [Vibrio sp. HA2012]|uniref:histidine phosphatase family protein n=1 Tax=Vibrio sp. HA2012 TaxID=1971595 RepID=UPI000C2B9DAE|nr:histidine phosphatase family protein [Vibrio sp. HA2012]PJC86700.1 histidine phosphatase family protein [Vibrio sp. HA2012]